MRWRALLVATLPTVVYCQDRIIPVTGLNTSIRNDGGRPTRLEINYLQSLGGPQWDLYILGLKQMQQLDQTDPESYFQIAGIHGRPFIPWNGVNSGQGNNQTGYCHHNDVPFITWHRPYVALYEQSLGRQVQELSKQYTGSDAALYKSAADTFRVPYWDWAVDPNLPPATTWPNITVNGPSGPVTIINPLYSFVWPDFPLNHDHQWFPVPTNDSTILWNETSTSRRIGSQNDTNGTLSLILGAMQDKVYATFAKAQDFDTMATATTPGPSFEDPHNDVHNAAGIFMNNQEYSAFDPVFWLHHTNVDRLFALWQAINYNSTIQSQAAAIITGTFTQSAGTSMGADDPLTPFYQAGADDGTDSYSMHTGRTIASTAALGYTYPEISDWSLDAAATRQFVIRQVNALYGPNQATTVQPPPEARPERRPPRGQGRRQYLSLLERDNYGDNGENSNSSSSSSSSSAEQSEIQYYLQIGVERSELDLPCSISVLLGSNYIVAGSAAIMALPSKGRSHTEIQLNRGLRQLTPCVEDKTVVVPLLEQTLRVEIRKGDGSIVPLDSVPTLTINVESVHVSLPQNDDEFPVFGTLTSYPKIGKQSRAHPLSGGGSERSKRSGHVLRHLRLIGERLGW